MVQIHQRSIVIPTSFILIVWFIMLIPNVGVLDAFPTGATQCLSRNAATQGHPQDGGLLSTQFWNVSIDDIFILNDSTNNNDTYYVVSFLLTKDTLYTITVSEQIMGIMIRFASASTNNNNDDVTNALSVLDGDDTIKLGPCFGPTDVSITHTSEDYKDNVTVTLDTTGLVSGEFVLDVTSVYSETEAVYSSFSLIIVEEDDDDVVQTETPTLSPNAGDVTTETPTNEEKDANNDTTPSHSNPIKQTTVPSDMTKDDDNNKEGGGEEGLDDSEKDALDSNTSSSTSTPSSVFAFSIVSSLLLTSFVHSYVIMIVFN